MLLPVSCSGAAYSGVNARPVAVTGAGLPDSSLSSSVATPKSSSFTCPCVSTSTFEGLRSQWNQVRVRMRDCLGHLQKQR
jgi:hypothetical protein